MLKNIFLKFDPILRNIYRNITVPPPPNLLGDRDIEYSWIASHISEGPGEALDFGAGQGHIGLIAAMKGFNVSAIDLMPII